jgi:hypothetical protein
MGFIQYFKCFLVYLYNSKHLRGTMILHMFLLCRNGTVKSTMCCFILDKWVDINKTSLTIILIYLMKCCHWDIHKLFIKVARCGMVHSCLISSDVLVMKINLCNVFLSLYIWYIAKRGVKNQTINRVNPMY